MSQRHPNTWRTDIGHPDIGQPETWQTAGAPAGGPAPARPQFDVELGRIFLSMRNLLGVTLWDMARRVGAEPTIIADLEAGSLATLPPWPELERLVLAYATETQIDPRPIFARLAQSGGVSPTAGMAAPRTITLQPHSIATTSPSQLPAYAPGQLSLPAPQSGGQPRSQIVSKTQKTGEPTGGAKARRASAARNVGPHGWSWEALRPLQGRLGGIMRARVASALLLIGVPMLILAAARVYPDALYGTISPLPSAIAAPIRKGLDAVVKALAPERDGLTWIEVGNPRVRKADRLPERAR